jgi:hypothetical protein
MNRQDQRNLLEKLHSELADIERQQEDRTLPHSDQQMLDQAWEDVTTKIDELEGILELAEEFEWHDAAAYLEEAEEDSRPGTPVPAEPVRAHGPRSVTLQTGISRSGRLMTLMPDGRWVPAPPLPFSRPPAIQIPRGMGAPTLAPPPPRPVAAAAAVAARICNCDSDGQCVYCEEEELERWNNMVDDREGCEHCAGCHYCAEAHYDGADEV